MNNFLTKQNLLLFVLPIILTSCRKDRSDPPEILWTNPAKGSLFYFGNTIHVEAIVQDDQAITRLSCSLINSNNTPVLAVKEFKAGGKSFQVSFDFIIDNPEIPTGDYSVQLFASDGETDIRSAVPVFIYETQRVLKQLFITVWGGTNQTQVFTLDTASGPVSLVNLSGDFSGSTINTHQNRYYVSGKYTGNLVAINTENNSLAWTQINNATGGAPFFTCLGSEKEQVLIGYYNGTLKGYSPDQLQSFFTETDAGAFPVFVAPLVSAGRLLVMEQFVFGGSRNLITYNYPGGNVLSVWSTAVDARSILIRNTREAYFIGNDGSNGKIYVYDLTQGAPVLRQSYLNNQISGAAMIDPDFLIVSTSQGIYENDFNNNNPVPLVSGTVFQTIAFDDAAQQVYASSGKTLFVYNYQLHQLTLLKQYQLPDSIMSVDLLFNREKF